MDLDLSAQELAFRDEVRAFLAEHLPEAPIGSPQARQPPSVLIGSVPPRRVAPASSSCSCSPSAQKPFSAMCMISAPLSVSCN